MRRQQIRATSFHTISLPERLPEKVVEQVRKMIDSGALKPGDQLPGERELSRAMGVGRTSVREALRALEALGLVEIRRGSGAYVSNESVSRPLSSRWTSVIAKHEAELLELVDVREALEQKAAAMAALNATQEDLVCLSQAVEKMARGLEAADLDLLMEADLEFHDQVGQASKNRLLRELNRMTGRVLLETRYAFLDISGFAAQSLEAHRRVLEAIQAGRAEEAARIMGSHLRQGPDRFAGLVETGGDSQ